MIARLVINRLLGADYVPFTLLGSPNEVYLEFLNNTVDPERHMHVKLPSGRHWEKYAQEWLTYGGENHQTLVEEARARHARIVREGDEVYVMLPEKTDLEGNEQRCRTLQKKGKDYIKLPVQQKDNTAQIVSNGQNSQ